MIGLNFLASFLRRKIFCWGNNFEFWVRVSRRKAEAEPEAVAGAVAAPAAVAVGHYKRHNTTLKSGGKRKRKQWQERKTNPNCTASAL